MIASITIRRFNRKVSFYSEHCVAKDLYRHIRADFHYRKFASWKDRSSQRHRQIVPKNLTIFDGDFFVDMTSCLRTIKLPALGMDAEQCSPI